MGRKRNNEFIDDITSRAYHHLIETIPNDSMESADSQSILWDNFIKLCKKIEEVKEIQENNRWIVSDRRLRSFAIVSSLIIACMIEISWCIIMGFAIANVIKIETLLLVAFGTAAHGSFGTIAGFVLRYVLKRVPRTKENKNTEMGKQKQ